jgi:hypothetical protein
MVSGGITRFRARIEINWLLSGDSPQPIPIAKTPEGRESMRRIIAAVAALVALVLGGGAGFYGY